MGDAAEPCPACGATDWDEYTPFEEWRGGRGSKVDGTHVPSPVVSCRVCGHEEREASFFTYGSDEDEGEDARAERIARARKHRWLSGTLALRAVRFPIYAAEGYRAKLGGSGSQGDELTEITVHQHVTDRPDADANQRPCLAITTASSTHAHQSDLLEARHAPKSWVGRDAGAAPDASHGCWVQNLLTHRPKLATAAASSPDGLRRLDCCSGG